METRFRLALAQINPTVGDLKGNSAKILDFIHRAEEKNVDLIAFPELALTGYPPEDLLLKPQFLRENVEYLKKIADSVKKSTVVIGFVDVKEDIYNALAVIHDGEVRGIYHKTLLPNYGVFDEFRYFQKGTKINVFDIGGVRIGFNICEDIWYPDGPHLIQALGGNARLIVNISASPYHRGGGEAREKMLATRAQECGVILAYVNCVGGQDELVFDGRSLVFDERGNLLARAKCFEEDLLLIDLEIEKVLRTYLQDPTRRQMKLNTPAPELIKIEEGLKPKKEECISRIEGVLPPEEEMLRALILGTRDYVRKNHFEKVVIGMSGGIDSSLVACIAVEALGKDNVIGVIMPSQYSSSASVEDATLLAKNLGIKTILLPIQEVFDSYRKVLKENVFKDLPEDVTEENIQARIRGNFLMALSNKFGWLVLTTGNKSEMSCGYTTLYGDMAGGFAVIKDVYKTQVYELAHWINKRSGKEIIPQRIFQKPPSAELRPNQTDQDTLPPYEKLDAILKAYVEEEYSFQEILEMGFDEETVKKVIKMVDRNEYKRRQAPPGIKVTPRAFGRDRRLPITNRYLPF
ncbi:MAG TPA: NAD+ synthase [bacterium]|nr:NAD+ synthase [bacterium]HEX68599.1 NAD+ synthase [bacterium]